MFGLEEIEGREEKGFSFLSLIRWEKRKERVDFEWYNFCGANTFAISPNWVEREGKGEGFWGYFNFYYKITNMPCILLTSYIFKGIKVKYLFCSPFFWKPNEGKNLFPFLLFLHPNTQGGRFFRFPFLSFLFLFPFPRCNQT